MKSTGIVRKVDELGRIVIPSEIRNNLEITEKDQIEIFTKDDFILLKKVGQNCVFCYTNKDLVNYNNKTICSQCISNIENLGNNN